MADINITGNIAEPELGPMKPCSWSSCPRTDTRAYMNGALCPDHAPPPVPTPDPTRTADALRQRPTTRKEQRR